MDRTRSGRTVSIPAALETDSADVRDALATASAMWASGDPGEALRWLRRAAEVATDAGDDERALQLFKATSLIGSLRPPPPAEPPRAAPVATPAPAVVVAAAIPAAAEDAPPAAPTAQGPTAAPDQLSEPPSPATRHDAYGVPLAEVIEARELPVAVRLRIALDVLEQVHEDGGAVLVPRASASRMRLDKVLVGGDGVARLAPGGGTSGTATLLWEVLAAAPSPSDPPPQLGEVAPELSQPVLAVVARALEPGADFTRVKHLLAAFRSLVASTAANHGTVAEATGAEAHARVSGHGSADARLSLDLSIDPVLQQLPQAAPRAARGAPAHDDHRSMAAEASPIPAALPAVPAAPPSGSGESPSPPAIEPSSPPAPPVVAEASESASPRPGPSRPATSGLSRPSASGPGATSAFGGRPAPRAPSRPTPAVSRPVPAPSPRLPTPRPAAALTPNKPLSRPPPPRGAAAPPPPSIDVNAAPTGPMTPMPLPPAPSAPPQVFTPTPTPAPPPPATPLAPGRPPLDSMVGLPFDAAARKRKLTIIAIAVAAGMVLLVVLFAALS